jgi:hypothetical protein
MNKYLICLLLLMNISCVGIISKGEGTQLLQSAYTEGSVALNNIKAGTWGITEEQAFLQRSVPITNNVQLQLTPNLFEFLFNGHKNILTNATWYNNINKDVYLIKTIAERNIQDPIMHRTMTIDAANFEVRWLNVRNGK